jgi:hypothetical protein
LKREKSDLLVSSLRARAAEESNANPEPELGESEVDLEPGLEVDDDDPEEYLVPEAAE